MTTPPDRLDSMAPADLAPLVPEELKAMRQRIGYLQEVAAVVSHDLKNSLSALLLGVQRLGRLVDEDRGPQAAPLVARLETAMRAMNELLDGLADLSRLDSSQVALHRGPVGIPELLRRATQPLEAVAAERGQRIDLWLSPDLPAMVECDAERLGQSLSHLVRRAVCLSPQGATIRVSAQGEPGVLVLGISDMGPSLPPDALAQLLASVPRPSDPGRRHQHLGLLIARCLVEAHGGRLQVQAGMGGQGSVFRVLVPVP